MNISRVQQDVLKATFGVEIEHDKNKLGDKLTEFSWVESNGRENTVIREDITKPTTLFKYLRRLCVLGEALGFEYDAGLEDSRAGSFHTHVDIPGTSVEAHDEDSEDEYDDDNVGVTELANANCLLAFATHMKRSEADVFRQAYEYRARLDVKGCDDSYDSSGAARETLPMNTKRYWICKNTGSTNDGTLENRLVENPAAYVNALLMPVIVSACVRGDDIHSAPVIDLEELNGRRPSDVEESIRDSMDFDGFMKDVLSVYGGLYGRLLTDQGPITNTYEKLPMAILYAALDGATQIEIHKEVVLPIFQNSRVFRGMLNKLSV